VAAGEKASLTRAMLRQPSTQATITCDGCGIVPDADLASEADKTAIMLLMRLMSTHHQQAGSQSA
jgi:hypothetical protein